VKTLVFTDLDDTLFQTRAKTPPGPHHVATTDARGQAHSFMTDAQIAFLEHLRRLGSVIPTTGRSIAGFARVQIPFHSPAIVNHGATILGAPATDGTRIVDQDWLERTRQISAAHRVGLHDIANALQTRFARERLELPVTVQTEHALALYTLVKAVQFDEAVMTQARVLALELRERYPEFHVFALGRTISFLPVGMNKRAAVLELQKRYRDTGPLLCIGVGDTLTDANFMGACDYAITPRSSQILRTLEGQHHVHQ
jgi:hydroxymethylpyrimidine pyrophosphatase-like HAD family hydrolase